MKLETLMQFISISLHTTNKTLQQIKQTIYQLLELHPQSSPTHSNTDRPESIKMKYRNKYMFKDKQQNFTVHHLFQWCKLIIHQTDIINSLVTAYVKSKQPLQQTTPSNSTPTDPAVSRKCNPSPNPDYYAIGPSCFGRLHQRAECIVKRRYKSSLQNPIFRSDPLLDSRPEHQSRGLPRRWTENVINVNTPKAQSSNSLKKKTNKSFELDKNSPKNKVNSQNIYTNNSSTTKRLTNIESNKCLELIRKIRKQIK